MFVAFVCLAENFNFFFFKFDDLVVFIALRLGVFGFELV